MIKHFYNLDEAFNYQRYCPQPYCSHTMWPESVTIRHDTDCRKAELSIGDSKLLINTHSNEIVSYTERSSLDQTYMIGTHSPIYASGSRHLWSLSKDGVDMFSLNVSCNNCQRYEYLLQVHISLKQGRIVDLVLNSETIGVEDGAKLCYIKNIYTTEKTNLIVNHQHLSHQHKPLETIEMPLIPIDVNNPRKALERIRKLVVFL